MFQDESSHISARCKFMLIGNPVSHSRSPAMHNAALQKIGSPYIYEKIALEEEELPDFARFARENLFGFNVTVPFKQQIIPLLDRISPVASLGRSVNTVKVEKGHLTGYSTDGYGLEKALEEAFGLPIGEARITFIGVGGATQAAAVHLGSIGSRAIHLANRTEGKAAGLSQLLRDNFPHILSDSCALDDKDKLSSLLRQSDIVIQGTSLGLHDGDPAPFDFSLLPPAIRCFDFIYHETPFLRYAAAHALPYAGGSAMLLHQGAKAFEIWTGKEAPLSLMRQALDEK